MSLRSESIAFDTIERRGLVTRRTPAWCAAAALVLAAVGCAPDAAVAPSPRVNDPNMYWALTLDHRAITMSTAALFDTIRLTATPRTSDGTPIATLPAPTYTSLDLERAEVSADGLVHVIKSGNKIPVVATLAVGNLRHSDTAFINVTDVATPPVLAAFSIHPIPPDSAKTGDTKLIAPRAMAADSTPIPGLSVYYTVSDPTTATIDRALGMLTRVRTGEVTVIATATAYGVTKADTVTYRIGNPTTGVISITAMRDASGKAINGFLPGYLLIGPGALVEFINGTGVATDVTFDDPTNIVPDAVYCASLGALNPTFCEGGNVVAFPTDPDAPVSGLRLRRFPVPGTYHYHSTIFGTSGTIVVSDDTLLTP